MRNKQLLRTSLLGLLLSFLLALPARADLWGYMDEAGVVHFAASQIDARYQLYYKGADVAQLDLGAPAFGLLPPTGAVTGLKPGGGQAAFVPPRRFASLDYAIGYKAVRHHIRAAAKAHAVDYALIKAVIAAESGFNPRAVSPKGAVGLMQLLPTTASQYGVAADAAGHQGDAASAAARSVEQKLTDPRTNIFAGARHLAYLLKLFKGDMQLAVAAYNAGQGAVKRAGNKVPDYKETQNYVKTVMGLYGLFSGEAAPAQPAPRAGALAAAQPGLSLPAPAAPGLAAAGGRLRVILSGASARARAQAEDSGI